MQVCNGIAKHEIDLLVLWPNPGLATVEVKADSYAGPTLLLGSRIHR